MVAVAPFRALRFTRGVPLATATSPPHDCVTADEVAAFVAADARNILQVVLPAERPGDGDTDKHQRAAALLAKWQADGSMARDAAPAYYRYEVVHGPPGDRRTMAALFARVALDPSYTSIRRHEKTLQRKKKDRLHLRVATQCDTEPIWLLYRDERGWVDEVASSNAFDEVLRFTAEDGSEHRLWRVDRGEAVGEITAQFEDRTLVIADGHHRYQTALDHFAATGDPRHGSILVGLVRDTDPGTAILATHRLVHGLPSADLGSLLAKASRHWDAQAIPLPPAAPQQDAAILAALPETGTDLVVLGRAGNGAGNGLSAHWLRLRPGSGIDEGRGRLDTLAVSLAHERLLRDAWGIDLEKPEEHLRFTRDPHHAIDAVRKGACQAVVMLPPEPVSAVLEVAQQGHVMPQKATYFIPKLRSGVVLSPLDEPMPTGWQQLAGDGGRPDTRLPRL